MSTYLKMSDVYKKNTWSDSENCKKKQQENEYLNNFSGSLLKFEKFKI